MRFRRVLALLLAVPGLALAASCAPVEIVAFGGGGSSTGAGAAHYDTGTGHNNTSGGNGGAPGDAGKPPSVFVGSFKYLCGGSKALCSPDPGSEDCAQGGNPGMGGAPSDGSQLTCQLIPAGGGVAAQCGIAGTAASGDPCTAAADCQTGLGCASTKVTPLCRPYCCDSLESCPTDTYCTKLGMAEAPQDQIPVCVPVTPCELLNDTTCPLGQTCAIVRVAGTTSCVTPGPGGAHQACPCAAGFTCSSPDNTCLKLCHIDNPVECGPNGFCQGGTSPYPPTIGYCVSY